MTDRGQQPTGPTYDYKLLCSIVGQLFIETRLHIEALNQKNERLIEERDQALSLLPGNLPDDEPPAT